jgi:hypothetical protein
MSPVLFEFNIQGTLEHAFAISAFYHAGIKDKGGQPYFKHPLWIASELLYRGATDTELSVGILHEKSWQGNPLRTFGPDAPTAQGLSCGRNCPPPLIVNCFSHFYAYPNILLCT